MRRTVLLFTKIRWGQKVSIFLRNKKNVSYDVKPYDIKHFKLPSSSCGELWPSAKAFFPVPAKKELNTIKLYDIKHFKLPSSIGQ